MKILLYDINFAPELTGVGKYTSELAAWLAALGHEVRVVTAPPYYPARKVSEGFSNWWSCNADPVTASAGSVIASAAIHAVWIAASLHPPQ